ncbi:RNA recognition motif domain-containing protein [Desulfonatronum parangueonense]
MENKLYVGNLSYSVTEDALHSLFAEAGAVQSVALIKDRDTGRSKGFAFVEMNSTDDAQKAIEQFHGKDFEGRPLTVNIARPREDRPRGGGDRYEGGGRGGRSGGGRSGGGGGGRQRGW